MNTQSLSDAPKVLLEGHEVLTVAETCQLLRISRPTFYRLLAAGRLTSRKVGARTIVRTDELRRFLSALPAGGRYVTIR